MLKKIFFGVFICITVNIIIAQEKGQLFLYIPDNETMADYLNMYSYLKDWDRDEIVVDDSRLSALFTYYIGKETLQSLLFESFLRYTKNKDIQNRIINYIDKNKINNSFANNLKKIYAAISVIKQSSGKNVIQYNYNNLEFEENMNLFHFNEVEFFNNELGLLLFDNDWNIMSFSGTNKDEESFFLIYGGGTNSMTIHFSKYSNINEQDIETKYKLNFYNEKYKGNWKITELLLDGILNRAGADKIVIAHGLGPDIIETIETATFNVYLYNRDNKILYEISYFMNFSPININFSERERIFNLLFFQILFVFLN
jgi:hypothetical protein